MCCSFIEDIANLLRNLVFMPPESTVNIWGIRYIGYILN